MVSSASVLYRDGTVQFQQDHASIHDSRVVQEGLGMPMYWPPGAPDVNPVESMWSEVNETTQEAWPDLPPRNRDTL
jgi:hypothetical protein